MAAVILTPEAQRQSGRLPMRIAARVRRLLQRLESWPEVSGARPLSGSLAGHWRMRTGDYRLQFHLRGLVVIVEKIGHRNGFYDD